MWDDVLLEAFLVFSPVPLCFFDFSWGTAATVGLIRNERQQNGRESETDVNYMISFVDRIFTPTPSLEVRLQLVILPDALRLDCRHYAVLLLYSCDVPNYLSLVLRHYSRAFFRPLIRIAHPLVQADCSPPASPI